MNFKEYVESLNKVLAEHPESADYKVIYAMDDEGNGYQQVNWDGTIGFYDGGYRGEFTQENDFEEEDIDAQPNAICIN